MFLISVMDLLSPRPIVGRVNRNILEGIPEVPEGGQPAVIEQQPAVAENTRGRRELHGQSVNNSNTITNTINAVADAENDAQQPNRSGTARLRGEGHTASGIINSNINVGFPRSGRSRRYSTSN